METVNSSPQNLSTLDEITTVITSRTENDSNRTIGTSHFIYFGIGCSDFCTMLCIQEQTKTKPFKLCIKS